MFWGSSAASAYNLSLIHISFEQSKEFYELETLYTLEDNYNMFFNEKSPDGTMDQLTWTNYNPLQFFVEQGKQDKSILDQLKSTIDSSIVKELYEEKNK